MTEELKSLGTGNIAGVATAVALGGPGALVMALPNLVPLLGLSRVVITLTNNYINSSHIA
jgi:Na+/alanine symporter